MIYQTDNTYSPEYVRDLNLTELYLLIRSAQEKALSLRTQQSPSGRVKVNGIIKPHLFKKIRRDIARFKTALRELNYHHLMNT